MASCPGFIPIGGTPATSSRLTRNGDKAEIARDIPIFEWRIRCSIKSAPTNSSFGSIRIGINKLIMYNKKNVEHIPQQVKHKADKHCMPSKYQSPLLKRPDRPFVVSKGTGLSANRPTAITPKIEKQKCSIRSQTYSIWNLTPNAADTMYSTSTDRIINWPSIKQWHCSTR